MTSRLAEFAGIVTGSVIAGLILVGLGWFSADDAFLFTYAFCFGSVTTWLRLRVMS